MTLSYLYLLSFISCTHTPSSGCVYSPSLTHSVVFILCQVLLLLLLLHVILKPLPSIALTISNNNFQLNTNAMVRCVMFLYSQRHLILLFLLYYYRHTVFLFKTYWNKKYVLMKLLTVFIYF